MWRAVSKLPRTSSSIALVAVVLLLSTALAAFLVLASGTSTTTSAQSYTAFTALEIGGNNVCVIKQSDGNPKCYGSVKNYTYPTDGDFVSIEAKFAYGCALDADGNASCWSNTTQRPNNITQRKYHDLKLSSWYSCYVVRDDVTASNDRKIQCEGWSGFGGTPMVTGVSAFANYTFDAVRIRYWDACGLVRDSDPNTAGDQNKGEIKCWGYDQTAAPPVHPVSGNAITFKYFDTNDDTTCGIVDDANIATTGTKEDEGKALCWGNPDDGMLEPPENVTFADDSVSLGDDFACGIIKDGDTTTADVNERENQIACWGNNSRSQRTPALGRYSTVAASGSTDGAAFGCAITTDSDLSMTGKQNEGALACWGDLSSVNFSVPGFPNDFHLIKDDTGIPVPPLPTPTPTPTPYRDTIKNVSAGHYTTCMTTEAGVVECFGRSIRGEGDPPGGIRVETVSVGYKHSCAISHYGRFGKNPGTGETWYPTDSNVVCWGDNYYGVTNVPAGIYKSVESGNGTSCGIKIDPDVSSEYGSIVCWGLTSAPWGLVEDAPTTSDFVEIKIGYSGDTFRNHACALKNDGEIVCWGDSRNHNNSPKEITVPTATGGGTIKFKSLAAGQGGSCGVIEDGDPNTAGNQNEDDAICWGETIANSTPKDNFPHHYVTPVSGQATPTVKFDTTAGPLDMGLYVTCGILKDDYEYVLKGNQTNFSVIRKAGTPYCEGRAYDYGGVSETVSYDLARQVWPWVPSTWYKILQYFPDNVESTDVKYRGLTASNFHMCLIRYGKDDDPAVGHLVCNHSFGGGFVDKIEPKPIATVDTTTANATYTCGSDTYNGASPVGGGRHPTAADSPFYVSIAPAGLANSKIIGVHMAEGGSANFSDRATGHQFSGKLYSATFVNTDAMGNPKCSETNQTVTTSRPIDICIPKAENSGRWYDWQMFKIENGAVTGDPLQGFTELGGSVCAEVTELPITVAAASKPIPTPTPTPTATPTAIGIDHPGIQSQDLVTVQKFGDSALANDVFVRVPGGALPSGGSRLLIRRVELDPTKQLTTLGDIYNVGDLYIEVNLVTLDNVDIGINLDPKAQICIAAPDGVDKTVYHLGDGATEWNPLPALTSALPSEYAVTYGTADFACGETSTLSYFVSTALGATVTPTPTATAVPVIFRIAPTIRSVTVSPGDRLRFAVNVFGLQDILDNSLADRHDITFEWSASPRGGSLREANPSADDDSKVDDREVLYIAPSSPGTYTLKAEVDRQECGDDDGLDDGCFAEIKITVRRTSPSPVPTATPANPAGAIPPIIIGADGNQYEVFTPEWGGNFSDEDISVSAEPGAVPNGEIIGIRAEVGGEASNIGQTQHRVTLDGSYYDIHAVDASGEPLSGYLLDDPVEVCIPVPPRLRGDISNVTMVSARDDGTFAILSTSMRLGDEGLKMCAALSTVSARVAPAYLGTPSALPSPTPLPTPEDPDTGGSNLPTSALVLLLMLGLALGIMSLVLARLFKRKPSQ